MDVPAKIVRFEHLVMRTLVDAVEKILGFTLHDWGIGCDFDLNLDLMRVTVNCDGHIPENNLFMEFAVPYEAIRETTSPAKLRNSLAKQFVEQYKKALLG